MNLNDPAYPGRAKEPEDAPVVLYYKGCLKRMSKTVGIVGRVSGNSSGKIDIKEKCAEEIAEFGIQFQIPVCCILFLQQK